ncbi:hypothetical protein J7L97_05260 [Candidatus Bathyarchaeota archaeon]|nr:hypothetical protein [Candidatus Bathyarchaeota archaeon]
MDSVKASGFAVLFIGVALLLFTFISAYQLLMGVFEIATSKDLMSIFGEALAPLISYAIRALYLGIMGWIGSILTRRGVQTITAAPREYEKPKVKTKGSEETEKPEETRAEE